MTVLNVFISYQRDSAKFTGSLVKDIEAHKHAVWVDQELAGGEEWWEQILSGIRNCDVFMFVVDKKSLESVACTRERDYAVALTKQIIPVLYDDSVPPKMLPLELARRNILDLGANDHSSFRELAKALSSAEKSGSLPDPLPDAPEIPISSLGAIASRLNDQTEMHERDQLWLFHQLKRDFLKYPVDCKQLLQKLLDRPDIVHSIHGDIVAYLTETETKAEAQAETKGAEPTPGVAESPESHRGLMARIGSVIGILGKIVPVVLIVGFAGYKIVDDSRSFSYKFNRDTADIRSMLEQLDDPGFPDRALITAHEELEQTRELIIREHRLDDVQRRPVDDDFAAWHIAIAEAGRNRDIPVVVKVNLEAAEKLDPDLASIPPLKEWLLEPSPPPVRNSDPVAAAQMPYQFRVVGIGVKENGDSALFGKTYSYLSLAMGNQALGPASFPTVEDTSLRLDDDASVVVDYPFTLNVSPTVPNDPLVQFKLYDRDAKNADAPYRNELLGHFSVSIAALTALVVGQELKLTSKDLTIGAANATLVLVRE